MVTVGFDLHKRYITACALDALGAVVAEHRRLEPNLDTVCRWLEGVGEPVLVAMEATPYGHWLERQLTARGVRVVVAHPYQVKLIWQARTKTAPIDARKLAELARPSSCRPSGFPIRPRGGYGSCCVAASFSSGSGP